MQEVVAAHVQRCRHQSQSAYSNVITDPAARIAPKQRAVAVAIHFRNAYMTTGPSLK